LLLFKRFFLGIAVFVFAAFITPTPISLPEVLSLAKADWGQLAVQFSGSHLIVFTILLIIVAVFWNYHRSLAEAVSAVAFAIVAFALLFITPNPQLSLVAAQGGAHAPMLTSANVSLRQAEHQLLAWASANRMITVVIVLVVLFALFNYYGDLSGMLSTGLAIVATLALLPYIYNIYPIPRHKSYYAEVVHELWLPAEKIVARGGHVYYGYALSTSDGWFTILETNKKIVYLPADDIVGRSVCQPKTNPEPAPYPPLIPILYAKPSPTPACARNPSSTTITPIVSQGESFRAKASASELREKDWPDYSARPVSRDH
jgi:hypothetical protein